MILTIEQREELRHETLKALAIRAPAALPARQLHRAIKRDLDYLFEEADVAMALEYLRGLGLAEFSVDELGATKYWRATTAGIQRFERA